MFRAILLREKVYVTLRSGSEASHGNNVDIEGLSVITSASQRAQILQVFGSKHAFLEAEASNTGHLDPLGLLHHAKQNMGTDKGSFIECCPLKRALCRFHVTLRVQST